MRQEPGLSDIDREAERVFGKTPKTKTMRYRAAMDADPETRWNETMKRVLENEQ